MNLQLLTGVIIFRPGVFVVLLLAWVVLFLLALLEDYKAKKNKPRKNEEVTQENPKNISVEEFSEDLTKEPLEQKKTSLTHEEGEKDE